MTKLRHDKNQQEITRHRIGKNRERTKIYISGGNLNQDASHDVVKEPPKYLNPSTSLQHDSQANNDDFRWRSHSQTDR